MTKEEIMAVVRANPVCYLKSLVETHGNDVIKVFRVAGAVASVWTMATNLAPKEYITL
jgi:hypothetical protein